tara:strand:+ start:2220 stop:2396 length:177 start_codon:yes stop_codon:yes gene_type:complete
MKNIKFTSKTSLILDGKAYRGYLLGELPMKFGFLYDSDDDKDGISQWFNMNGLTWLLK